jgi:hydroxylysine kinase
MVELSLRMPSDRISEKHLSEFVTASYGLDGSVQRLGGEKDDNFVLTTEHGESYLVKIAHPHENPRVVSLQTSVLEYLSHASPGLPVQRVVRTLDGVSDAAVSEGPLAGRRVRVTSYLEGTLLRTVGSTPALRREIGATAARLDEALKGFDHVGLRRSLLWDVGQAAKLLPLLDGLPATDERRLLQGELDHFVTEVLPRLRSLRTQAVHNDLSTDNLLVSPDGDSLAGILDFGDVIQTQLVNEVAIAASYQLSKSRDLTNEAIDVVAGYHATTPLADEEIDLLPRLIVGRVLMWVIIPKWRSARLPANNAYVLRNAERSWSLLLTLLDVPHDDFAELLHQACRGGH